MTAAENLAPSEETVLVPIDDIKDSTVPNYRKSMDPSKLAELTESIRQRGVLVPIVVRPQGNTGLELVYGQRRVEAAKRAGLLAVPAFVRSYDDEQVREARITENLLREDCDPLEEAEAFAELERMGLSASAIAAKLGQSVAYVGQRLKLTGLCADARMALTRGQISIGVAVLIARLPDVKTQQKALKECASWNGDLLTVETARENIEARVLLDLANAPFKLDDATLVPKAGPCTTCPKRTGNQAELFPGDTSADQCTDPPCHKSKLDALWQLRVKAARAEGVEVLDKKLTEKVLRDATEYGSGPLVRLDERIYGPGGKTKTLRQLLGQDLPTVTLARDPYHGVPVELVPRKVAEKAIKAFKPTTRDEPSGRDNKSKNEREAEILKAEVRRRTMTQLVAAMEQQCAKGYAHRPLLRLLVRGAIESVWTDITKKVADRRGLPLVDEGAGSPKKGAKRQLPRLSAIERIDRALSGLDEGQLLALLLELVMGRAAPGKWSEGSDCYVEVCAELGVDPKAIEATVKAERKEKAKAKGVKAKTAPETPEKPKAKRTRSGSKPAEVDDDAE
jgi:ParB/RepB/Spo0J family partition protein